MEERNIGFEMRKLMKIIKSKIVSSCDTNLTANQNYILGFVTSNTKKNVDIFQKDIENELKVGRSTVTEILQIMEREELILRVPVLHDKRLKKIVLGAKGKKIDQKINSVISDINKKMFKDISKEELDSFYRIIKKIEDNITYEEDNNV